jgi:hypothetical protein
MSVTTTREDARRALKAWAAEHGRTPTRAEYDSGGNSPCSQTIRGLYGGSWVRAIKHAELQPRTRRRERWSCAVIERALKADAKRRKRPPTASEWARSTTRRPSTRTVVQRYGSWRKALEAVNLPVNGSPRAEPWTRQSIAESMLAWRSAHGHLPTSLEWKHATANSPCAGTVARVWGSWSGARAAVETGTFSEPPELQLEREVRRAIGKFINDDAGVSEGLETLIQALESLRRR